MQQTWWPEASTIIVTGPYFKAMDEFKLQLQSVNAQFGSKSAFFVPCGLEIWWMTLKNNRALFLYYVKHFASVQSHRGIQIGVTVWKRSIQVKIGDFFVPCEIWRMTLKYIKAPLLCYFNLCASFYSHQWIQTGVTVQKHPTWFKISNFSVPYDLEIWQMTLKNNRTHLLCYFKHCASFHIHIWIQTGVTVCKWLNWFWPLTLTFHLWPWPFAWTQCLWMAIHPENCMMIHWQEHWEKKKVCCLVAGRVLPCSQYECDILHLLTASWYWYCTMLR